MRKIKHFFEESWLVVAAAFCFGLLIAITNATLAPRIEQNRIAKFNRLASGLLPQATEFAPVDEEIAVQALDGRPQKLDISRALANGETIGWVFRIVGSGFGGPLELLVAVDAACETLEGFGVLTSSETPGVGDKILEDWFQDQFDGAPAEPLTLVRTGDPEQIDTQIVAVTGATASCNAVVKAINHYLPQVQKQLQQKGLIGNGN